MTARDRLLQVFTLDLRSLALMRVLLGALILLDLALRAGQLEMFYSDFGVLPREAALTAAGPYRVNLYLFSGDAWFAGLLMFLEALTALALLAGLRTRLAVLLTLLLHASLLNRNPLIVTDGDELLCCLLFWSLFLPVHARFSIDAALSTTPAPESNLHRSWAGAALLLQVVGPYFCNALAMSGRDWWPDGSALYYVMSLDAYADGLGRHLLAAPALLQALTVGAWLVALLAPLLALSPVLGGPLRFAALLLLAALHVCALLFLDVTPAPLFGLAGLAVLAGSGVWDHLARRHAARHPGTVRIFYDADCAFCLRSALLLREFLLLPRAAVAPAQDTPRARELMRANNSWVVIDTDEQAHLKWAAWTVLVRRSPLLGWAWPLLRRPRLVAPGDRVYDLAARHRQPLGAFAAWLLPQRPATFATGRLAQGLAGVFLFMAVAWNALEVNRAGPRSWQRDAQRLLGVPMHLARIDQDWDVFAPAPPRDDGWFVIPAHLRDGSQLDLRRPAEPGIRYDKPADVAASFGDLREKTYLRHLWSSTFAGQRLNFGRYLCRHWNRDHVGDAPRQLMTFKIEYMLEPTPLPGATARVERRMLWRHECFPEETRGQIP